MSNEKNKIELIEITEEKSTELAIQIDMVKTILLDIDVPYLEAVAHNWKNRASMYDSAAVLISGYNVAESDLNKAQHRQLQALLDYIEACQEVETKKKAAQEHRGHQERIDKLFKFR